MQQSTIETFGRNRRQRSGLRDLRGLLIPALGVALLSSACSGSTAADAADSQEPAEAVSWHIQRGPFEQRMLLTGELVAEKGAELQVPNAGIFPVQIRYLAEEGTEVQAGDVVAEFDNSQILSTLENLKSSAEQAENELLATRSRVANEVAEAFFNREQRKADLEKAEIAASVPLEIKARQEYERDRFELEKAKLELNAAEAALQAKKDSGRRETEKQELTLEQALRDISRVEENLDALTLKAPRDGIFLVGIDHQGRRFITGGNSFPGFILASLPDLSTLMVEARLFDVDDDKIQAGDSVVATLDTFPDWQIPGVVREVGRIADSQGTDSVRRSFKVLIDLETMDSERMRPGMSVKLELLRTGNQNALLIPRAAISESGGKPRAHLRNGSPVDITLGDCNPTVCELRDGPPEGTELIAAGGAITDPDKTSSTEEG